jgi:hypothetical protein
VFATLRCFKLDNLLRLHQMVRATHWWFRRYGASAATRSDLVSWLVEFALSDRLDAGAGTYPEDSVRFDIALIDFLTAKLDGKIKC